MATVSFRYKPLIASTLSFISRAHTPVSVAREREREIERSKLGDGESGIAEESKHSMSVPLFHIEKGFRVDGPMIVLVYVLIAAATAAVALYQ